MLHNLTVSGAPPENDRLRVVPQPFEMAFLGGPVWRAFAEDAVPPTPEDASSLVQAAESAGVKLIVCRVPYGTRLSQVLADAGFRAVENLVTFRRDLAPSLSCPESPVTPALPGDRPGCIDIGRTAFLFDRFHRDVGPEVGDAIKAAWIDNAFAGRADVILVSRSQGRPTGFVSCLERGDTAVIDLIAVAPAWQGQGIGRSLICGVLAHYTGRLGRVQVGTQEDNWASCHLYHSQGFEIIDRHTTFHWSPRSPS
ncbi:GNAT family N-acetyltransferase [Azospirillum sp. A29]|uniref:GNAT family N-acetyltransferase n=1 Tax=Azospirillum sp. A29 TaxID=3160606 RepID=UPI0036726196